MVIMSEKMTVTVTATLLLLLMIGTIGADRARFPFRDGLIMLAAAGAVIGFGGLATGTTNYRHVRHMGMILFLIGVSNSVSQAVSAVHDTDGFFEWFVTSRGVWGWSIVSYFGLRLMVFTTGETHAALDTIASIRARGCRAEIEVRQREG